MARLEALKRELQRMIGDCRGGKTSDCLVLEVQRDHSECIGDDHDDDG